MASTFLGNQWFPEEFEIDILAGMERIRSFGERHASSVCDPRDDLISQPAESLQRVGELLGWENLEEVRKSDLPEHNNGSPGDTVGTAKNYQRDSSPLPMGNRPRGRRSNC